MAVLAGIALACGDVWSLVATTALGRAGLVARSGMVERKLTPAPGEEYERSAARGWCPSRAERTASPRRPVRPGQGDAIRAAVASLVPQIIRSGAPSTPAPGDLDAARSGASSRVSSRLNGYAPRLSCRPISTPPGSPRVPAVVTGRELGLSVNEAD